ncbi:DNA-binding protein [Streptomyces eurocidicus]|uniref:DNA-binding protein n=2 Tax=Streptomyces eurocidicus TaxID=66423 RepID=A0A2N8P2M8_STREU|nr:helix-turn-helix transcriptional regulator [Streptomyces eurocidicus]PNE35268.1 DNA-binding protein [Streptomyces eurocidicus]
MSASPTEERPLPHPHPRQELAAFLTSCRTRMNPGDTALRHEELAVLAGVGASWYRWLEQGREITVPPEALDAVARVLRLDGPERRRLYALAGLNPPPRPESAYAPEYPRDGLRRLVDGMMPRPAHIMDPYWNLVAHNDSAGLVLGFRPGAKQNCLVSYFTDPVHRARATNWDENARRIVARFRAACAEHPGDEGFREVVAEASAGSPEFAGIWARDDVRPPVRTMKEYEHPLVGTLYLETTRLPVPARPDLVIVLHDPVPESGTAAKVAWLNSLEGRSGGIPPVEDRYGSP